VNGVSKIFPLLHPSYIRLPLLHLHHHILQFFCQFHNPILLYVSYCLLFFIVLLVSLTCQLNNSFQVLVFSSLFLLPNCFHFNFLLLLLFLSVSFLAFFHILINLPFLHNHFLLISCVNSTITEAECSESERDKAAFYMHGNIKRTFKYVYNIKKQVKLKY
jgi:hypothetical protein